ncbi:MAG: MBL fold metallo-hydrolase [Candidatus Bathyarchaeia archaeon]
MNAKIVNVYNDRVLPDKGLKGGWGDCFHITFCEKKVLFDAGYKGKILMNNIRALGISVDEVDKLVLSHGHRDHTGGLPGLLEARTVKTPLPVIAHPAVSEPKFVKIWLFYFRGELPRLPPKLAERMAFQPAREPTEVLPNLYTTGEIPIAERPQKPGIAKNVFHQVNGRREHDDVIDDLSLILQAKTGLVLITGCCHAGLLNTCAKATKLFGRKIEAIVGGTHMLEYSKEDVDHVADVLEKDYGTPTLYLNHCTGDDAIEQLRARFGPQVVHDCFVGSELTFDV